MRQTGGPLGDTRDCRAWRGCVRESRAVAKVGERIPMTIRLPRMLYNLGAFLPQVDLKDCTSRFL